MLKEYQKTSVVKAEQLTKDNEWALSLKYDLIKTTSATALTLVYKGRVGHSPRWLLKTGEDGHAMGINYGDWIVSDDDGKRWAVIDEIFKKTYKERSVAKGFDELFNALKSKLKETSSKLGVEWYYSGTAREVMMYLKTDDSGDHQLVGCRLDKNISNEPQMAILYHDDVNSTIARYIVCALNALAGFADEWQKLEEWKNDGTV